MTRAGWVQARTGRETMAYTVRILIHDDMSDRPRRWVRTEQDFKYRQQAERFAETFDHWVPVQGTEVVPVDD